MTKCTDAEQAVAPDRFLGCQKCKLASFVLSICARNSRFLVRFGRMRERKRDFHFERPYASMWADCDGVFLLHQSKNLLFFAKGIGDQLRQSS